MRQQCLQMKEIRTIVRFSDYSSLSTILKYLLNDFAIVSCLNRTTGLLAPNTVFVLRMFNQIYFVWTPNADRNCWLAGWLVNWASDSFGALSSFFNNILSHSAEYVYQRLPESTHGCECQREQTTEFIRHAMALRRAYVCVCVREWIWKAECAIYSGIFTSTGRCW